MANDPMFSKKPTMDASVDTLDDDDTTDKGVLLVLPGGQRLEPSRASEVRPSQLALDVFQSHMCRPDERNKFSNMLDFWDLIPRFSAEGHNSVEGTAEFPNNVNRRFRINGREMRVVQTPGYYTKSEKDGVVSKGRRYPGYTECIVEQALIKIAVDQAYLDDDIRQHPNDTTPNYSFHFSLGDIQRVLRDMGMKRNKQDIRRAVEVLSDSMVTITGVIPGSTAEYHEKTAMISNLRWVCDKGKPKTSGTWHATLNRIVSQGIINLGYRQYRLQDARGLRYFGLYIYRKLIVERLNLSTTRGLDITFCEIRDLTFGLNFSLIRKGIAVFKEELDKMCSLGLLSHYETTPIKQRSENSNRPVIVDTRYTLYPSAQMLGQMKAASRKTRAGAEILGLSMDRHNDRRFQLPLPIAKS